DACVYGTLDFVGYPRFPAPFEFIAAFFFSSRRRHTRSDRDWSSDVCSSDLLPYSSGSQLAFPAEYGRRISQSVTGPRWSVQRARSEERRVGKECRFRGSAYLEE